VKHPFIIQVCYPKHLTDISLIEEKKMQDLIDRMQAAQEKTAHLLVRL
jgi:hypothetical protein